jgi:hypothetical protein
LAAAGCAHPAPGPGELIAAAIAARGGPIEGFARRSDLVVHYGFPGHWQWELSFRRPDRFRLTLLTSGDDQIWESDGTTLRTYLGSALVAEEPAPGGCFDSLARWLAITSLDAVLSPPIQWSAVAGPLPYDAAYAARVHCDGLPQRFELYFDRELRLLAAEGPASIPTLGSGRLLARYRDYRRIDGRWLPQRIEYTLDGQPFCEESVVDEHLLEADAPP